MTTQAPSWFDVDKDGLEKLLDRRGRYRILAELPSNAFDEEITRCDMTVVFGRDHLPRGIVEVSIEDDSPDGFRRLSDAWTLFAPSYKTGIATKRGRFNLGEKLFLAMAKEAVITTTTGSVTFSDRGREESKIKTERGTKLTALVRMTKRDAMDAIELLCRIIPPAGVTFIINGVEVENEKPIHSFTATLPTEIEGDEGWRPTERKTTVDLYEVEPGLTPDSVVGKAMIYEMGIPVVEYDGRWHINVEQKIPLNSDRDNVTPSYLRKLHTAVLNNSFSLLTEEDTTSSWVKEGMPRATGEAVTAIVHKRFGEKVVTFDPSDLQANKEAAAQGYTVIPPRAFDKATWFNIRQVDVARAAGRVTPSHSEVMHSADGVPPLDRDEWTPEMARLAIYAQTVASVLLDRAIQVQYYNSILIRHVAWYGGGVLSFNIGKLGWKWINAPIQHEVDALLIHELAHEKVSDHLSSAYYQELCRLGAKFRDTSIRLSDVVGETTHA